MRPTLHRYLQFGLCTALGSLLALPSHLFSQSPQDITVPPPSGFRCRAEVLNGDTVPVVDLNTIYVYTDYVFKTRRQSEQWTRVKYNVKKVYPYAILAAAKLKEYNKVLATISDEDYKKIFLKTCEKDLRGQFEDELKGLTVSQGRVLMKLIDRETNQTKICSRHSTTSSLSLNPGVAFPHGPDLSFVGRLDIVG